MPVADEDIAKAVEVWHALYRDNTMTERTAKRKMKRLDFWNDPDRWAGITDPHKQMFWDTNQ